MPIQYVIDHQLGILLVEASGHVTVDDRARFVSEVVADPLLPDEVPIIIDVSGITNVPSPEDVPKMASLAQQLGQRFQRRIAYYVTTPGFVTPYMLAAISACAGSVQVHAYTNRMHATRWLRATDTA